MKKLKIMFGIIFLMVAIILLPAQQYDAESDFTFMRSSDGNSVTITGYVGSKQTVSIPTYIRELPVTIIGNNAFLNKNIINITIPNSIIHIGNAAFRNNQIISLVIPDSVTTIEMWAFGNNQLSNVTIPNSVRTIYRFAFVNNPLINIVIGNNVRLGDSSGRAFTREFDNFYRENQGRSGTYINRNGSWSEDW